MPKVLNKVPKAQSSHSNEEDIAANKKITTDIVITDKAIKRVIAPFVRIVRKDIKYKEVEEAKYFSLYLKKKPSVLIRDLSSFLSDTVDLVSLLHETSDVLQNVTKADGVTLYMMDPATNEIYQSKKIPSSDRFKIRWKIKQQSTVATYVAYKKDYVMVDDILEDERFPEGIGYQSRVSGDGDYCLTKFSSSQCPSRPVHARGHPRRRVLRRYRAVQAAECQSLH